MMPYGDVETTVDTVAGQLAKGPWFLGDTFTALDVYFGSAIRWTLQFGILPERPVFRPYVERLTARPAAQRAQSRDDALAAAAASAAQKPAG